MSGHCIDSDDFTIVVDKWDASFLRRPGCKPHYFFLTHLHADHIKGLTSTWSRIIYTSPFNAWLLPMRRNVKQVLLKEIELNITHTIRKSNNEIAFQVTLLDANHCPGAVMFLFQGKFGNILYTGDFRYTPKILDYPVLSTIIRNKELSVLYLDNTYAAASCKFPSREAALVEVLKIIDGNPDCKILIGMRQLGKEEVLRAIALHVNEKVCVSSQRLQILSKLEYEDVFTTDTSESRIHAVELHTITQKHSQEPSKVVSIKLTSMYECGNLDRQRGNIYVVPYSDHSSHTELVEFVDQVRPLKLYPIVLPKIPKMTADTGPYYRMSTVNCVVPEEILQLCGPAAADAPAPAPPVLINGPPLCIKFHPDPVVNVEKKPTSVYIDEGMNLLPFDSMSSHLTNNNKARKHIKASWTRLAPKILSPKGIKFSDSSPEKTSDKNQGTLSKVVALDGCSSAVLGVKPNEDKDPIVPFSKGDLMNENADLLFEVPLSDGDDDLDMPSSARELGLRMQHPLTLNGSAADKKPDVIENSAVVIRRTRSKDKFEIPTRPLTRNTCNDSDSVISDVSSVRFTRSRSSVSSVPVASRSRTRHSLESLVDVANDRTASRMPTRSSPKESPNARRVSTRLSSSPNMDKNGLSKKSVSLENLTTKSNSKESLTKKRVKGSKGDLASNVERKDLPGKKMMKGKNSVVKLEVVDLQEDIGEQTPVSQRYEEVPDLEGDKAAADIIIVPTEKSSVDKTSPEKPIVTDESNKKPHLNGNISLSNFNGIHINSPGRKRVPLSCDWNAAQEIAKKETEQALKALESLNQMKGFKTRNLGNRIGLVALRRLSADSIPIKSPVKNQNLVVLPVSPTGLRSRTASILSSMANNFSKSSTTKHTVSSSSLKTSTSKDPETPSAPSTTAQIATASACTANQTTATSSSSAGEQTAIVSASSTTKQPAVVSSSSTAKQPMVSNSSTLTKQSATASSSALTKQPVTASSSALTKQSVSASFAALTKQSVTTSSSALTKQSATASSLALTKQSVTASFSASTKQVDTASSVATGKQSAAVDSSATSELDVTSNSSATTKQSKTANSSVTNKQSAAASCSATSKQAGTDSLSATKKQPAISSSSATTKQSVIASSSATSKPPAISSSSAATKQSMTASSSATSKKPVIASSLFTFVQPAPASVLTKQIVTPVKRPETRSSVSLSPTSPVKELSPIAAVKESKKTSPRRWKPDEVVVKVEEKTEVTSPRGRRSLGMTVEVVQCGMGGKNKKTEDDPSGSPIASLQTVDSQEKSKEQLATSKIECSSPSEVASVSAEMNEPGPSTGHHTTIEDSQKSADALNQGLFLTDETLASTSRSQKTVTKASRRSFYKRQNDLNLDLIRLKVGFAMTQKGPKRLSLPSRLSSVRRDNAPIQSKQKVQDWKRKLSVHLRKSPQRRYRFKSPSKLRENAKRTLATILRSGRSLSNSQGYHADVEDCTDLSQTTSRTSVEVEENSGYAADIDSCTPPDTESSHSSTVPQQLEKNSQCLLTDSLVSEDSKLAVQMELRRSSRLVREEGMVSENQNNPSKPILMNKSQQENNKSAKTTKVDLSSLSKVSTGISPIQKTSATEGCPLELSSARFSDKLSERSRMIFRKSADSVLAPESSNILSFMADAFKNSVPLQTPTTANILSSMAENFKKLDEGAQVSPSLSIQLVSSKSKPTPPKGKDPADWGVQITRIDSSSNKTHDSSQNSSVGGLPISSIPKSLSIEIIPESSAEEPVPRKGPSPPTVTISPEVIDLSSDCPEEMLSQSTIHSLPISPGPRRVPQGGSRWPPVLKPEVQSPPQAVWKEKRRSSQSGDKVIIDIQTQEDPQKVPHCPVHCTCGAASKQGTCMGTMRNLIEADADCLYEVPLSPEDFEDSGAMLALGRGWIESCFEDAQDRDEFMNSYQDILPTLANSTKQAKCKPAPNKAGTSSSQVQQASQSHVKQVFSSSKQNASSLKQTSAAKQSSATTKKQTASALVPTKKQSTSAPSATKKPMTSAPTAAKKQAATTPVVKQTAYVSKSSVQGLPLPGKQKEGPKKRLSTDVDVSKSSSLLKDIEKKGRANSSNEHINRQSVEKIVPSRRSSSQSTASSSSVTKSKSSKRSTSPAPLPPPSAPAKRRTIGADVKKEVKEKEDVKLKRKNANSPASSSDSPETKKARCNELERLTDTNKGSANKRYRLSIRRSLDHLMTRQKLRSDRRVKASSSSRS